MNRSHIVLTVSALMCLAVLVITSISLSNLTKRAGRKLDGQEVSIDTDGTNGQADGQTNKKTNGQEDGHSDGAEDSSDGTTDSADDCVITIYPSATGVQVNKYTITYNGKLIIIDGGWEADADSFRELIAMHGNHVDAWIITHPHKDHAGAFNAIMTDPQGITVGTIYDNSYDYDFIEEMGEPYDDIEVMETFHELTKDADNVVHLKRDDVVDICGLKFEIFNAFDEVVIENIKEDKDYQNNAALIMKLTHNDESFLFTSDVKDNLNDYLFETYGERLKCTYVQMSHHGNWGFSYEMYSYMDAEGYYFDLPRSFFEDGSTYPAKTLREQLYIDGKKTYDLDDAPHIIRLGR